ncbi:hypothetical protein, partial [Bilophila wadsworthia]|uniref:hypothetical protein n=1 Tax=Bilophila wadsworthia TaxID=35833 RepID=UPI003AB44665
HYKSIPVIFQTSGHTKKECLKDGWLPEKIRISNMFLRVSTHSGIRHTEIIGCYHIPFPLPSGGPSSQPLDRPLKNLSAPEPVGG